MGLPISPGIDGLPTSTIPDDPQQFVSWFKTVGVKRWLANADVRNSDSTYPVQVSGSNSTNATLGLSTAASNLVNAIESIPSDTVVGNVGASAGTPGALTATQLLTLLAINTALSVQGNGSAANPIELVGDSAAPGNSFYYGTNASGIKGWYVNSSGGGSGGNPTAKVGLTAVNGSATTFLRSDGSPPIDQTIAPTWTGLHTFNDGVVLGAPASGVTLKVSGTVNGADIADFTDGTNTVSVYTATGQAYLGSTSATPLNFVVGGVAKATLNSGLQVGSPTGGDKGAGTVNATGLYVNGTAVGGGGSSITTLTQAGGASQSYSVPAGANFVQVICWGGGGGGGSGALEAAGTATSGGSGGGSGGCSVGTYRAADLGSSVTVTFSNTTTGGNGGAQKTSAGVGNGGVSGSNVSFGTWLTATGGSNGGGGGTGGVAGGAAGSGSQWVGLAGGSSAASAAGNAGAQPGNTAGLNGQSASGGGGGGGTNTVPNSFAGGSGANNSAWNTIPAAVGGTSGGGGGNNGNAGSGSVGATGGSGGGGATAALNGGAGGNGGQYGGGGGGGGSVAGTGTHSGAGGNGAPAACIIVAW